MIEGDGGGGGGDTVGVEFECRGGGELGLAGGLIDDGDGDGDGNDDGGCNGDGGDDAGGGV
jgi:hypothetical protein